MTTRILGPVYREATPAEIAAMHEHDWKHNASHDGCHGFGSTSGCACGAVRNVWLERARGTKYLLGADSWFDEDCPRCVELKNGAPVAPLLDVIYVTDEKG